MIYAHILLQSSPPVAPQDYGSVDGTVSPTTTSEPVATRGLEWLGQHPGGLFVCPSIHYSLALVPSAASAELFITNQRSPGELRSANSHPQKALRPQGLYTWYPHRKPFPADPGGNSWFPWEVAAAPSISLADKAFAFRCTVLAHRTCHGTCPQRS